MVAGILLICVLGRSKYLFYLAECVRNAMQYFRFNSEKVVWKMGVSLLHQSEIC